MIVPIVLAGGIGTRLWPLSRALFPKQFLSLHEGSSLLQETLLRINDFQGLGLGIIVCHEEHRFVVAEQLHEVGLEDRYEIILEPIGKNTAPAIAIAALQAMQRLGGEEDPILLVLPADHKIKDKTGLEQAVCQATPICQADQLVTFGVEPTYPAIGYGYIGLGELLTSGEGYRVAKFIEKPPLELARDYLTEGGYYWNSGIFMFKSSTILSAFEYYAPVILSVCRNALVNSRRDLDFLRLRLEDYAYCPVDSIDYAILEKSSNVAMVPLISLWSDLGSWHSLWAHGEQDKNGNVIYGDVVLQNVKNCYLRSESRLITAVGLENCILIETPDVVLVANKDQGEQLKKLVAHLQEIKRPEVVQHNKVHRPWGVYEIIFEADTCKVKYLSVNPNASLSLQQHQHRSEHWVVLSGEAEVVRDDEIFSLLSNQSTYIPAGSCHRLRNPGEVPLEIIEVQTGSYLGEDDIIRFADNYGRAEIKN